MGQLFTHRGESSSTLVDSNQPSSCNNRNVVTWNRIISMGQSDAPMLSSSRPSSVTSTTNTISTSTSATTGLEVCSLSSSSSRADRPKNSIELEREWKICHADKSPVQALRYLVMAHGDDLHSIICDEDCRQGQYDLKNVVQQQVPLDLRQSPEYIAKLFRVEMESTLMEQIIKAMHLWTCNINRDSTTDSTITTDTAADVGECEKDGTHHVVTTALNLIYRTMHSITTCGRFSLNVSFMNDQHQSDVRCILERLHVECKAIQDRKDDSEQLLGYTRRDVETLSELYHVRLACH